MKKIVVLIVWLVAFFAVDQKMHLCAAQDNLASNIPPAQLQNDLISTNGATRFRLAKSLALDHTKATFTALLKLLHDTNVDISYAAAVSIEKRKDVAFDGELINAIGALPRDNRWPAYSAAKNYPTPHMMKYLWQCLNEEIEFQGRRNVFDNRNCFYLSQSLEQIAHDLGNKVNVKAPGNDYELKDYQLFASGIQLNN
jgi:hypothetical protein